MFGRVVFRFVAMVFDDFLAASDAAVGLLETERPPLDAPVTGLTGHYELALWPGAPLNSPVNTGIRD